MVVRRFISGLVIFVLGQALHQRACLLRVIKRKAIFASLASLTGDFALADAAYQLRQCRGKSVHDCSVSNAIME